MSLTLHQQEYVVIGVMLDDDKSSFSLFEAPNIRRRQASKGHILLIKPRGKRRNFYEVRDLTIICHQFYVVLKQIVHLELFDIKWDI